jgi:Protein of unknown function (DUF3592)
MASTAVAWFLPAGFVAIGSAMIVASLRGRVARARWEEAATRTEGEVTDLRWQSAGPRGDRSLLAFPVVRFSLPDGRTVETQSTFGTNPPQAKRGQQVIVLYDPHDPTNASLPAGGTAALVHYVLIILGGILVFVGLSAAVFLAMVL